MKLVTKKTKREKLMKELDKLIESVPREEIDYIELTSEEIEILLGSFLDWVYLAVADFTYKGIRVKVKK